MEESAVLDRLMLFGLTRQEAAIYLELFQSGEMTGYEVAKQTGISRSNVYSGLSGLVDKGAAYLAEGSISKYTAVPVEEFCENKIESLSREKEYLTSHLPRQKKSELGYLTISGNRNIWDKMIHMIRNTQMRIYFSASHRMIEELQSELLQAVRRNVKLVLITDMEISDAELKEKSICYLTNERGSSIRLIVDSVYALTGELTGSKEDTCLYTGQENFIEVFKDALRNEIRLIELTKE